jgi:hypothetical protein
MSFHMRDIKMSRIVGTARLHIEAVAAALFIGYGDGAPSIRHTTSIGEDEANIAPAESGPRFRMDRQWRKIMLMTDSPISLTPGTDSAFQICPSCQASRKFQETGGDTVSTADAIPGAQPTADGLALAKAGYSFYAMATTLVCDECHAESYLVELNLIAKPELSREWANRYLWLNEEIEEPEISFTVTLHGDFDGLPHRWRLRRLETPEGQLDRHCFGPFPRKGDLGDEAEELLGSIWPLLTGDDSAIPF